ncbi:MAG: hypothetical protein ACD_73C00577G0001 [uncultured bacterium]|nr:MAG: hypothetical protein ACD_73C00577G0001 [uncultured bacterium]
MFKHLLLLIIVISFGLLFQKNVLAQEVPIPEPAIEALTTDKSIDEPINTDQPADTNEAPTIDVNPDEDNEEIKDEDLFGSDSEKDPPAEVQNETHLLKFEFNGSVVFMAQEKNNKGETVSGEPYLEVTYGFLFETPIELTEKKKSKKMEIDISVDHWGSLAKNEFFDCQLDIDIPKMPVEISTKIQKETPKKQGKNNEDIINEDLKDSLILKINMDKDIREDWFSLCTDFGGTTLNTQGDPEDYHNQIIKMIDPSLSAIIVDDFDEEGKTSIELTTPKKVINDLDIRNDILLSGQGQITIEAL